MENSKPLENRTKQRGPRTRIGICTPHFINSFHSIIGLVVKFPLAMREPRVRYDTVLRFLTIIPDDAIVFALVQKSFHIKLVVKEF
jgi:hypothetical protein